MVSIHSAYLVSVMIALVTLQAATSPLKYDPYTECTSYNIGDENFPGRGTEVEDTCIVTVLEDPNHPKRLSRKLEGDSGDDISDLEAYFGVAMELKLRNLPLSAVHSPSPWAGWNWLTYQDSLNYEWNEGQPSPAEKYAVAFGLDVKSFKDNVSAQNGIDSRENYTDMCTTDKECYNPDIDIACAKRSGESSGYCIPTWYGICHAWAPAAILEKEPNCPVTYNGVTFQPMDIKALVTDVYNSNISVVFTGSRYNGYNDSIDEFGVHSAVSYRDLNPGYFHIAAANLLGLLNTTFIIDRDAGKEVWNQPVVGFEVYEQINMTTAEAASTFYRLEEYVWNKNASSIVYVKSHLSWINETLIDGGLVASGLNEKFTVGANYTYLLELDENEEIIGGEWLHESNDNHPDFLWIPKSKPSSDTVTSIGLSYANVTMLLEKSAACGELGFTRDSKSELTA